MEWQTLHDIAGDTMANKIGSDQVLDDLLYVIPEKELEKYLRQLYEADYPEVFKKLNRENGRTKRNLRKP